METITVPARVIAEHILWLRRESDTSDNQLSKLVYLCHGWMLGLRGQALIEDDVVVAETGPMVQGLTGLAPAEHPELGRSHTEFISMIVDGYGLFSGDQLSDITHEEGTPWYSSRNRQGTVIPTEELRNHYQEIVSQEEAEIQAARSKMRRR